MVVECVTIETNHLFQGNPLAEQHRLRFRSVIERQAWDIPTIRNLEYDQYDNPASTYLVWRDAQGVARGVSRLYPTDRPFMLKEHFRHLVTNGEVPTGAHIWEGSRFCIDKDLDREQRKLVAQKIILAYLEFGLDRGITQFVGIMHPVYWQNLFMNVGWQPTWFGNATRAPDGKMARAGSVTVSEEALQIVREKTGIHQSVLDFGATQSIHLHTVPPQFVDLPTREQAA